MGVPMEISIDDKALATDTTFSSAFSEGKHRSLIAITKDLLVKIFHLQLVI